MIFWGESALLSINFTVNPGPTHMTELGKGEMVLVQSATLQSVAILLTFYTSKLQL